MTIRIAFITNDLLSDQLSSTVTPVQQQLYEQGIESVLMALNPRQGGQYRAFSALTKKSQHEQIKQRFALPFDLLFYLPSDQSGDVRQVQGHLEVDAALFWLNEDQLQHHCSALARGRGALNEHATWIEALTVRSHHRAQELLRQWPDRQSSHPWGLFGSSLSALSFLRQWLLQVLNASLRQFPLPDLICWIPETLEQLNNDPERLTLYHQINFLRQQLTAEHPKLVLMEHSTLYGLDQMSEDPDHLFATFDVKAENRLLTQKLSHLFLLPGIDLAHQLGANSSSLLPPGQEPGLIMATFLISDPPSDTHQQYLEQLLKLHFWPWLKLAESRE